MNYDRLLHTVATIHTGSQQAAGRSLNQILSVRNWLIGAWIIEYEQAGEDRARYGERVLHQLAAGLAEAGVEGLSRRSLNDCRQVALAYPEFEPAVTGNVLSGASRAVWQTSARLAREMPSGPSDEMGQTSAKSPEPELAHVPSDENRQTSANSLAPAFPSLRRRAQAEPPVDWRDDAWVVRLFETLRFSHLLELSRIGPPLQRAFYEVHCLKEGWSVRELKRQRGSLLFERAGLSIDKAGLLALAREDALFQTPQTVLRDPYVLEFLDLGARPRFTESDLEQALLDHLQAFLLELGQNFCFMGRQHRVTVGGRHHFIDLLFYHRGLRCLVAIDLKTEAFRHEHAGQMNFYVNCLADQMAREGENRPIGVLLCTDKDIAEVRYATAGIEESVFVSRYLVQLPSEEQLARWLRDELAHLTDLPGSDEKGNP